jgi:hypothetical protein
MKFCRDCKHCIVPPGCDYSFAKCALTARVDPVSGDGKFRYCADERVSPDDCGPLGRYFEPQDLPASIVIDGLRNMAAAKGDA